MSRILRLGLDLDGVFADFNTGFARTLIEATGRNLFPQPFTPPWQPQTWSWWQPLGYRKTESDAAWAAVDADPLWWATLNSMHTQHQTERFFSQLQAWINQQMLAVFFLTTRPSPNAHWQSVQWLRRFGLQTPQVLIADHATSKGELARILRLDAFLDDYPANLAAVRLHAPETIPVLVEAAYNADARAMFPTIEPTIDAYLSLIERWVAGGTAFIHEAAVNHSAPPQAR